ncbi:MAG: phosphoglycerate mutase (2,3-diphosphoglycerate-independent), partial [Thermomicrobiales bacterium]|nr:phosphoglycerate mutase (2,3-diphosphoglycerate-independent) [Thermomicrobiales bacterium]
MAFRPVVLTILDGWGLGPDYPGNAVIAANTPTMDRLWSAYPKTTLRCSGRDVGLPEGQMGNSEVGHLNIGAGFIVYQWITRIDAAIEDQSFYDNDALLHAVSHVRSNNSSLHLLGLIGDGGVHAYQEHLYALLKLASQHGLERVYIHAFMDGRDTPPQSGIGFMRDLVRFTEQQRCGRVATISGRYYAMDRDRRWDRTQKAYNAIVAGAGQHASDPIEAIQSSYDAGVTDEFIVPVVLEDAPGRPISKLDDGDALIFFNFRSDRARQLTEALTKPDFSGFARSKWPDN